MVALIHGTKLSSLSFVRVIKAFPPFSHSFHLISDISLKSFQCGCQRLHAFIGRVVLYIYWEKKSFYSKKRKENLFP